MERKQVKEILSKQLQLLAEVSKKSQLEHLPELTLAMCQIVDCLKNESEPYVTVSQKGMTDSGDKKRISDVIRRVLHDDRALEREEVCFRQKGGEFPTVQLNFVAGAVHIHSYGVVQYPQKFFDALMADKHRIKKRE